jgi:urea transport system substrate-binding protein
VIDACRHRDADLTGRDPEMPPNHHHQAGASSATWVTEFDVVWKTDGLVPGDAWSKELDGSKDLIGDWVDKKCGNYNTKTSKCGS